MRSDAVTIPVIRLHGTIMSGGGQFRPVLSLASTAGLIEKLFSYNDAPVVAISINSPGGSPVQSRLIYRRIRDLAAEKNKTVLMFVEDVAASGGYMIAVAGDEIIADPSSIVGSIGVVSASFGLNQAINKLGIERRVHTAGSNKAVLDPFLPEKPEDVERLKALQLEVHATFIDIVKERRAGTPDRRSGSVHGPVLDGQARHRARPRRCARRHARHSQAALRAEDPAAADHPAAWVLRPPARHFRLERRSLAWRYRRRRFRRFHRRGGIAIAVEQVRPLKRAAIGAIIIAWRIRMAGACGN